MSEDRRTKAQILEALEKAEAALYDAENRIPAAPSRVPEADALAACIRALDNLSRSDSSSGGGYRSYVGSDDLQRNLNTTQRVIEALAVKYAMPPEKPVMVECRRRHVEDLTPIELVATIQGHGSAF